MNHGKTQRLSVALSDEATKRRLSGNGVVVCSTFGCGRHLGLTEQLCGSVCAACSGPGDTITRRRRDPLPQPEYHEPFVPVRYTEPYVFYVPPECR